MATTTLKDVAAAAGVSISTASRSLAGKTSISDATRTRVQNIADKLNYRPNAQARALRSARSHAIGLIIPSLDNPYFAGMAAAVEKEANTQGIATMITSCGEDPQRLATALEALGQRQVDGIIAVPLVGAQDALAQSQDHHPLILIDRELNSLPAVVSDPSPGLNDAITQLKNKGHTKIGYLSGPQETSTGRQRLAVFKQAAQGMDMHIHQGNFRHREGYKGAIDLLHAGVTAIVAGDSMMTAGALEACHNAGKSIGKEIALVGFDDFIYLRFQAAPISVVDQNVSHMGRTAAAELISSIENKRQPQGKILPTRYIPRMSTAHEVQGENP
ncbi:substrate-binding domain-containing protein [Corynebacterium macginleyi]|uniref:LacI family DNA-binding transcriptional regulator n=1 Tax=Corynebacterium macginleyi TaxID=38290 RepID=A0ABS1Y862_9CORY|nr:LacI family DNA-binding transcriptional regulator [Corynebacterium macginleyi]MBK4173558.1 substrate-binding domain-containing protein [Corynebacterium macginleyi]MBM0244558.1 LacI family DNA-binding transcriptional regulator [Corynebacterium macginleyi]